MTVIATFGQSVLCTEFSDKKAINNYMGCDKIPFFINSADNSSFLG